jgi:hypothetical protein
LYTGTDLQYSAFPTLRCPVSDAPPGRVAWLAEFGLDIDSSERTTPRDEPAGARTSLPTA